MRYNGFDLLLLGLLASNAISGGATAQPATGVAQAPVVAPAPGPTRRPRIGLALGGGGAKGAAHVGVLRVLDEMRIPIDCVAGTSMGALVGATFAAGASAAEVESEMRAINWAETVGGEGRRERTPIGRKLAGITYTNSLEFGIGKGRLLMPGGLLSTQRIEQALRSLVSKAQFVRDFDDLPIPFRAVATDMQAGEMVVLDSGELAVAMRASMAAPGVFSPVVIDGKLLSDGGLVRNLPVDVARELCADVVIAVRMSSPSPEMDQLASALTLIERSLNVSIDANERLQLATLTAADVAIDVPTGDMGSADFQLVPDAIKLGRAAAEAQRVSLARYSVPEDEYRAWAASVGRTDIPEYTLADVHLTGVERVNPDYVRAQLYSSVPGATVTAEQVTADTERIYELGDFERVDYRFAGEGQERDLEINVTEKSWGPSLLRADFGLSTYEGGNINAIIRADHDRTWVNKHGGRWHNALQIGRESLLTTDFYQPIDVRQRFFWQPILFGGSTFEDVYLEGERIAEYSMRELYTQADLGMNFGTVAQLRMGLRHGWNEAELETGFLLPSPSRETDTSVQVRILYDTRDSVALPTRGAFLNARYVESRDWLHGEQDYSLFETVFLRAFRVRREGDSLSLIIGAADTLSGELPLSQDIQLGGIRTFPGLRPGELRGDRYWFAGSTYGWRLFDTQRLFGGGMYAGLRFQAGRMDHGIDATLDGETLLGLSGSVSARTPVGPFVLSLGYVDNGSWELQFTLGRPLSEGSMLDELY